jgi:acyl carrier protein
MSQPEILVRVQKSFADILKVPVEKVTPESRLVEDLDVDSLFITQLALGLEDEFEIFVSDGDMPALTTVNAVVEFVAQKLEEK